MNFFKNVLWSLFGTIGVRIIGLLTSIVLARLLTPDIFGIVGMALVVVGFVYIVQEAGISSAIIQKKAVSQAMVSTAFYLNIIFSFIITMTIILLAPLVANFYSQPELKNLLYYSAVGILIASVSITQRGLLMRERQFRKLTIVDMTAEILTSAVAIILAIMNYPLLAVSLSMLFRPAVQSICLILISGITVCSHKPEIKLIKEILPYSLNVLGVRVVNYVRNNIDYLLIGKLLGATSLGIYTIAFQWSTVARFYFSQAIANVAFPEISRNQNDLQAVGRIYMNMLKKISFFTFPFCIILIMLANEFILIVYGEKWKMAISIMQILMIAGMISSIGTIVGAVFKGVGRPDIELKVNVFSLASFTIMIYIGSFYGLIGVSFAVLLNTIIFDFVMVLKVIKILNLKLYNYFCSIDKAIYSSIIMCLGMYLFRLTNIMTNNYIFNFIITSIIGVLIYILASIIFKNEMIKWVANKLSFIVKRFPKTNN